MNKKVIIAYNDSRQPNKSIRSITGDKSYGEAIFKRKTLREHTREVFSECDNIECFVDDKDFSAEDSALKTPVIRMYSDFVVYDKEKLNVLITKALCAHDNYKVTLNNKVACVIYKNVKEFLESNENELDECDSIPGDCFYDISEVINFRRFITSGFEARFFNSVSGDEYTVVKSSDNIEKIKAEYTFYTLLPADMKQWFVEPYNYMEDSDKASYSMLRYHMTDLAIRYVHGAIGITEYNCILDKLFYFLKIRKTKSVGHAEYEEMADKLYIQKVHDRIALLKKSAGYDKIASLISTSTDYNNIDEIVDKYIKLYENVRSDKKFMDVQVVSHGDLCFSNILFSEEVSLMKLIDPKGAIAEDGLYMDPYYDIAKLSHSICGLYDFYNSDRYEIVYDEGLKARIQIDADTTAYVDCFKNRLTSYGVDYRLIRIYEVSLFLSMLPLHMDRPKKVFAFILNALDIMDTL